MERGWRAVKAVASSNSKSASKYLPAATSQPVMDEGIVTSSVAVDFS